MCHQKKLLQGSTPEDTDSSIPSIGIEAELPEYYPQQLNSLWKRYSVPLMTVVYKNFERL